MPVTQQALFNQPVGLAMDGAGNLYVADSANFTIRKVAANGTVLTLAGSPGISGSSDGSGSAARFSLLTGIAVDGSGNVYVADNSAIRKITPAGNVTTLAGAAGVIGYADGAGAAARFNRPWGVAVAADGTVFVADSGNYVVRAIGTDGTVSTHAGTQGMRGRADGSRATATFLNPQGIALDTAGNLYVTDWYGPPAPNLPEGSTLVRKIAADGAVSTVAGTLGGETGPAAFRDTFAIATDGAGNVYLAAARSVHRVSAVGTISPVVAASPAFQSLEGIALDGSGNVYVADRSSHAVSRVTPSGDVSVYAGKPGVSGSADTNP
ncbi:hypothetical protein [Noviherbaspirillum aridicola]|uniref:NHL repeat-containing protein n=1 Tax=Noviherbaspirillum aridicola TaxID=2849687 RepID=A0ABQ4Q545_9BURK|nr:hypothetical protein [Noviherbaspirillum aridicola]GIZ52313.1 hypothetical protein NCCP691_23270 [Noviherbaspirillum aridicola]